MGVSAGTIAARGACIWSPQAGFQLLVDRPFMRPRPQTPRGLPLTETPSTAAPTQRWRMNSVRDCFRGWSCASPLPIMGMFSCAEAVLWLDLESFPKPPMRIAEIKVKLVYKSLFIFWRQFAIFMITNSRFKKVGRCSAARPVTAILKAI